MTGRLTQDTMNGSEIAIIGMSCRFPGARNLEEYWRNLRDGVESISFFTDQELEASGIDPVLLNNPNYVKAKGIVEDADLFDASFFGFTPREAETMDPQQRLFLECAWTALESAGYDPDRYEGLIGVYGGVGPNTYFLNNLYPNRSLMNLVGDFQIMIGNDKDYLTTRVSYKMNMRGPSIVVQTACSTSLVAVAQACQSLLSGECDIALAGASSINVPTRAGYLYQPGGIKSPDGHCRAFEARAEGTVFSDGVGIVVLKRLEDALADRDSFQAVIKAAALNNDGSLKIGYTAPSIEGQAKAIRSALIMAELEPEAISYIETHGTGTALGDPIEVAALTRAFRSGTEKKAFCAIGSVKTNIGHTDTAAGIAGLIKTVLMLENRMIPPTLHFERPNPEIDFDSTPFYVNARLSEWKGDSFPRRAGVSSFGVGGTNAHVIVEEAPIMEPSGESRPWKLMLLSARTVTALDDVTTNMALHLKQHSDLNLADVAYTLQTGRKGFNHRRMAVCRDAADAAEVFETRDPERVYTTVQEPVNRDIVFMFSGQGSQYVNMGLELYQTEAAFRDEIDRCSEILQPQLSFDLRKVLYPEESAREKSSQMLTQTYITQPALFTIEYALAKLWISWGVEPAASVGHSIGEYVAACLAGVFSLEDALSLVAARGRLMQDLPAGSMLAVPLSEQEILPLLDEKLSLAVINGTRLCVISGEKDVLESFRERLAAKNLDCSYLQTSHAFHSLMMEPILDTFTEMVRQFGPMPPQMPFVSNVSGTWITAAEATSPAYWAMHLRRTVRFSDCLGELLKEPNRILLEVGPGSTLRMLAGLHPGRTKEHMVLSSVRHPRERKTDSAFILNTLGQLWLAGGVKEWTGFYRVESRNRLPLPTYPFERKRFWVSAEKQPYAGMPEDGKSHEDAIMNGFFPDANRAEQKAESAPVPASRDEMEQTIIRIWKDTLGIDQVNAADNFFDLGGHSLLAVSIVTALEKSFGVRLPLASLIEAPTVRELVQLLDERNCEISWSNLVPLHANGSKTPFFLMHSHGGNILEYQPLANLLKNDRPIYAVQCSALDGGPVEESSIEEMAVKYLKEIRAIQPNGPYFLGGYCFGGNLSLEIAHLLREEREEVGLLAMINSATHLYPLYMTGTTRIQRTWFKITDRLALEWEWLRGQPFRKQCQYLKTRAKRMGDLARTRAEAMLDRFPAVSRLRIREHSLVYHLEQIAEANDRAWERYRPRPYDGKVIFLRARRQPQGIKPDPLLGWGGVLTGEVHVHEMPGFRQNILDEPSVSQMARIILEHLP
jgi:phthiocerol/phenolphthiocerol synthesis type-I polyketide synthase E